MTDLLALADRQERVYGEPLTVEERMQTANALREAHEHKTAMLHTQAVQARALREAHAELERAWRHAQAMAQAADNEKAEVERLQSAFVKMRRALTGDIHGNEDLVEAAKAMRAEVERLRALLRDVRRRSFDGLMNDRIDAELGDRHD